MITGNGKAARATIALGLLFVICGIRFWDVIRDGLACVGVAGPNAGRVQLGDLESALSSAVEPISLQQTASEQREVFADDSIGGEPVSVMIRLDGLPRQIYGDTNGVFPPVTVRAHQRVHVRVSYPEGIPGEVVQIQTQDGGTLDKDQSARVVHLDAERIVAFWFESSGNEGTHRVTVRRGFDEKTLDFWVGSKPALHVVR
jgi:hypothetical protein